MKGIFSAATFVAIASALVSAAPLKVAERSASGPILYTKGADFIRVTSEGDPNVDQINTFGTQIGYVARTNGNSEFASFVSFDIPPMSAIAGASASSTCNFVVKNPAAVSGSQTTQLFTLGAEFGEYDTLTFNQHPYYNQYEGAYFVNAVGESSPIDVFTVPCQFGENMQFVMRPQNDNDDITWTQDNAANVGAFIEIRN
jgi:hypothetical protein